MRHSWETMTSVSAGHKKKKKMKKKKKKKKRRRRRLFVCLVGWLVSCLSTTRLADGPKDKALVLPHMVS